MLFYVNFAVGELPKYAWYFSNGWVTLIYMYIKLGFCKFWF